MPLKPTNWGKIKKYPHDDTNFSLKFKKIEETISRLELARMNKRPCDKYGYLLKVGDMTNKGIIREIITNDFIVTEQGRFYWSYVQKL